MKDKEFNHPAYINIPYFVLKEKRLDLFNKLLFSFLWSFSVAGKKIKASNDYLADLFEVSDKHIQNRLKMLEDLGFIKRTLVKYKRVIEITHLVLTNIESDSPNLSLVPPTVGASTNIELPPTTVGVQHQPQLVSAPTTVGTYNKAIPKVDTKAITPISPKRGKSGFGLSEMLLNNPYDLPQNLLEDWMAVRKGKRATMTATAWNNSLKNIETLGKQGLSPERVLAIAITNSWAGLEVRYFKDYVGESKNTPVIKAVDDKELREKLKQQAIEREKKEEEAKERDRQQSGAFMKQLKLSHGERMAQQEADRKSRGMTTHEYHEFITKGVNK